MPDPSDNGAFRSGAAYFFEREGAWRQRGYIKASAPDAEDLFGWRGGVAVSFGAIAVGAEMEDSSATGFNGDDSDNSSANSGAVYVIE